MIGAVGVSGAPGGELDEVCEGRYSQSCRSSEIGPATVTRTHH